MKREIQFSKRLATPDHVLFREVDGESVLLNLETEKYLGLDDVGTRIWLLLTSEASIDTALLKLKTEYDVEDKRLRADVEQLINELLDQGLVEFKDA